MRRRSGLRRSAESWYDACVLGVAGIGGWGVSVGGDGAGGIRTCSTDPLSRARHTCNPRAPSLARSTKIEVGGDHEVNQV